MRRLLRTVATREMTMPTIESLFILHTAKSSAFAGHKRGDVAFVTNGFRENGVLGFVEPNTKDRVYRFRGLVLSTFAEATVQVPPFIARGNGGSGLLVLEPRAPMTTDTLAEIAAHINAGIRWRFSWSRQATVERVRRLEIPAPSGGVGKFSVRETMPTLTQSRVPKWPKKFAHVRLDSLYTLHGGDFHEASKLPAGPVPLVSCGDTNNGIMAFVDVPDENTYQHRLTISFNGMNTLTAKYHPYKFAAKDDVAVCEPLKPLQRSTEVFVQVMLNRERWRYSHYRKCFIEKLRRFDIPMPARGDVVDEPAIAELLEAHPYWKSISEQYA